MTVKLYDTGVYLVRGREVTADGPEALQKLRQRRERKPAGRKPSGRLWHTEFWKATMFPEIWSSCRLSLTG